MGKKREDIVDIDKVSFGSKMGVLFCAMVSAIATGYVPNYINLYYTDNVGIPMAAVGIILMLTKITDGITDIIMGMIVDRTKTKLGKARPWVLAGGFGIAISIILLFNCPGSISTGMKIFFCAAFYFLANPFFGTMVSVACGTLNNLVTADSKKRGVLGVFSAYGSLLAVIVIGLVVPVILSGLNESQKAYTVVTFIFAAMSIVATILGVILTKEAVTERSADSFTEKQPIMESLRQLVKNKYFIYLAIGTIAYNLSAAPVATYYAKYIFKDLSYATIINLPGMAIIFLLPLAVPFINKVGKRNSVVGGLLFAAMGHLIVFFANDNVILFMLGRCIASLAVVPFAVALVPLTGEICDYALYKSGKPMDGIISSAATMGGKIGIGLVAGVSSLMLAWSGYISSETAEIVAQPDSALFMLRFLAGLYATILYSIAAFCFYKIDLEKNGIEEIQAELKEKGLR